MSSSICPVLSDAACATGAGLPRKRGPGRDAVLWSPAAKPGRRLTGGPRSQGGRHRQEPGGYVDYRHRPTTLHPQLRSRHEPNTEAIVRPQARAEQRTLAVPRGGPAWRLVALDHPPRPPPPSPRLPTNHTPGNHQAFTRRSNPVRWTRPTRRTMSRRPDAHAITPAAVFHAPMLPPPRSAVVATTIPTSIPPCPPDRHWREMFGSTMRCPGQDSNLCDLSARGF